MVSATLRPLGTPSRSLVSSSRLVHPSLRLSLPREPGRDGLVTGFACPVFTCGVYHALKGKESAVRWRLEQCVPSVWRADSHPTVEGIVSWSSTCALLLKGLQSQFGLPFAWLILTPLVERGQEKHRRLAWPVFGSKAFSVFYRSESMRQTASHSATECADPSLCVTALEKLYLDYFGEDVGDELVLQDVESLRGDQITVWSMLLALYTVGVLGFVFDSDAVALRVQAIVDVLWPCVKRVALANGPAE